LHSKPKGKREKEKGNGEREKREQQPLSIKKGVKADIDLKKKLSN